MAYYTALEKYRKQNMTELLLTFRAGAFVGVVVELRAPASVLTRRWATGIVATLAVLPSVAEVTLTPEKRRKGQIH